MATAGYPSREYGHTGQGFSYLWSALGAAVGGPEAAAAFFQKASWHLDLVRRSDGSFTYDGGEQYGAGETDDNTNGGFVAGASHDWILEETPVANVVAMTDAVREFGVYQRSDDENIQNG
jgi:hypothetical protein